MAGAILLYGLTDSVYVRIARIALIEKGVAHTLCETNVFDPATLDPAYEQLHAFRRIPALDHDGFRLYETSAIARYVDENFSGPALQPADPRERARMNQIISIVDSYGYPPLLRGLVIERLFAAEEGRAADEARVAASVPAARHVFAAIMALAPTPFLTGAHFTLADAWLAAFVAYILPTPEGAALVAENGALSRWWAGVVTRPSLIATRYPKEA
ncbi:MAG: glutathione S-transferase family protein [Dongiaceae bacterium]